MTRLIVPKGETASLATAAKSIAGSRISIPETINVSATNDEQDWISLRDHFKLMQEMTESASDETLGMSQRSLAPGTTDFIIDILFQAKDLEDAMKRAARTYNLVHGGYFNEVRHRRGCIVYTVDDRDFPYTSTPDGPPAYFFIEGVLIFLHAMLTLIVGTSLSPHVLCVRSRRPANVLRDGYLAFWETTVRCGATTYALEYNAAAARLPVRKIGDQPFNAAAVYEIIDRMIAERERRVAKNDLAQRVSDLVGKGITEQSDVARDLGLSVATLRRRLNAIGTKFRDLKNAALNKSAQSMLRQGRPIVDTAEALKYVDVRSFSRAFKAWNGVTPAAFIQQQYKSD